MLHTIYVSIVNPEYDARSPRITEDFKLLTHERTLTTVRVAKGYKLRSNKYTEKTLSRLAKELLVDPVTEKSSVNAVKVLTVLKGQFYAEVTFKPGITDNEAMTLRAALRDILGEEFDSKCEIASTLVYAFVFKQVNHETRMRRIIERFLKQSLMNPLIEDFQLLSRDELVRHNGFFLAKSHATPSVNQHKTLPKKQQAAGKPAIPFTKLGDAELEKFSKTHHLHLSLAELQAIQNHYRRRRTRNERLEQKFSVEPTRAELEALAQTWSEHCKHKIFAADIEYVYKDKPPRMIRSLYKCYIKNLTHKLSKTRKDLLSVFHDNAGVFAFTKEWSIAMKVETHNTPAALDPFGGALTGIVGVNRDILGTGIGAKPLFNTNVFCFADPRMYETRQSMKKLPDNVHHPKRMLRGVHYGVERGGNESGIPTVNGAMVFDERFLGRPLVFCGTGGLLERMLGGRKGTDKPIASGDYIVTAGGRVGKDGIHGATASSSALDSSAPASIVQIGDPITQKKLTDFLMEAKEKHLYRTLTDNGAGGLSSSVGEMAQLTGGADLNLERVPLKYPELAPWEILVSESQERMTLVVSPQNWKKLQKLARVYDTEVAHIGKFTTSGVFRVFYAKRPVAHLPLSFLHDGTPRLKLRAHFKPSTHKSRFTKNDKANFSKATLKATYLEPALIGIRGDQDLVSEASPIKQTFLPFLKQVLMQPNIASKESWVRRYDHEVKARTVVKPFAGANGHGVNDAAVIRPLLSERKGLAIANGILPRYGAEDTYTMTAGVIDEAVRNLVAVGTDPETIVGLDNFAWPDPLPSPDVPDSKEKLGQLVRSAEALYDTCLAYKLPLISGKDSMKNDTVLEFTKPTRRLEQKFLQQPRRQRVSIPPTLLFTALGTLKDIATAITAPFKATDSHIYLAGMTYAELGGSEYASVIETRCRALVEQAQKTGTPSKAAKYSQLARRYQKLLTHFTTPQVRTRENLALYQATHRAITKGLIRSAHDLSDGGLLVTLSECAFGGMIGAEVVFDAIPRPANPLESRGQPKKALATRKFRKLKSSLTRKYQAILGEADFYPEANPFNFDTYAYSESHGRFLFEVAPENATKLRELFRASKIPLTLKRIGRTRPTQMLKLVWKDYTFRAKLETLRRVWKHALDF